MVNKMFNKIIWTIAIAIIFLNSIYFSIKLKFPQFRLIKMFKTVFKKEKEEGITTIDALFMSLAAKIGVGSLAGIAFAIYYGGIGTIFWIWFISFFVAINSFLEKYLSVLYKEKDGSFYKGGPAYYIKKGLNNKNLAIIYSIILIFAYIIGFLSIQSNTITVLLNDMYSFDKTIISIFISVISAYFIFKGLKSISNICNKIVPIMSIIYIIIGMLIFIINIDKVPIVFINIIRNAFNYRAISGGFLTALFIGIQKAIFSSEAGIGTGGISAGATTNNNCLKQGYIGIIETYFINIIITTITAFIIILSNYTNINFNSINGIELTKYAFSYHLGHFGEIILVILIVLFAISTIITGYYYGESNLKMLTNSKKTLFILKILTILLIFIGGISSSLFIWNIVDFFVAILAIINILTIYKLKNTIKL